MTRIVLRFPGVTVCIPDIPHMGIDEILKTHYPTVYEMFTADDVEHVDYIDD